MGIDRSENMRRIKARNTKPELAVRKLLWESGFRGYRLHWKQLPGKPDIVFVGKRKAILVHGCFWHGHYCKIGSRQPLSNRGYWLPKIDRNRERDAQHLTELAALGWSVLTVWECELLDRPAIAARLNSFLASDVNATRPSDVASKTDHH